MRRWIFGALKCCFVFPSLIGKGLLMTYLRTSSSFCKLNNLRILLARLGPRRLGTFVSVNPAISYKVLTINFHLYQKIPYYYKKIDSNIS